MTKKKREKPLGLDIEFGEALERFIGVDPGELPDNVKLNKKPKPKKNGDGKPSPGKVKGQTRDKGG